LLIFEREKDNLFADFPIGATIQDGGKRKRSDDTCLLHRPKRKIKNKNKNKNKIKRKIDKKKNKMLGPKCSITSGWITKTSNISGSHTS